MCVVAGARRWSQRRGALVSSGRRTRGQCSAVGRARDAPPHTVMQPLMPAVPGAEKPGRTDACLCPRHIRVHPSGHRVSIQAPIRSIHAPSVRRHRPTSPPTHPPSLHPPSMRHPSYQSANHRSTMSISGQGPPPRPPLSPGNPEHRRPFRGHSLKRRQHHLVAEAAQAPHAPVCPGRPHKNEPWTPNVSSGGAQVPP